MRKVDAMFNVKTKALTLTASQCARLTGLTVKALRVYEREGLLKPKRTLKDWRLYDAADLTRLGEVSALRAIGLKLADIAKLLHGKVSNISDVLELKQSELLQRRMQIDASLATVSMFRKRVEMGEILTINDLALAIRETKMNTITPEAVAWKRYEQMRPRIAIAADPETMKSCCGRFVFEGGTLINVFMQQEKLFTQIPGQPAFQLFAEGTDAYFQPEVHAQITFDRDAAGIVASLTLHQNGFEQKVRRATEKESDEAFAKLKARMEGGQPHPESRRLVKAMLDSQLQGKPCLDLMIPELAAIVIEQNEGVTREFVALGQCTGLTFLTVTPEGWDAYRATFENGELDVSMHIDASGKISGQWLEPPKADSYWKTIHQRFNSNNR
jgi:DNA-binding transcriptional MerR regulator